MGSDQVFKTVLGFALLRAAWWIVIGRRQVTIHGWRIVNCAFDNAGWIDVRAALDRKDGE